MSSVLSSAYRERERGSSGRHRPPSPLDSPPIPPPTSKGPRTPPSPKINPPSPPPVTSSLSPRQKRHRTPPISDYDHPPLKRRRSRDRDGRDLSRDRRRTMDRDRYDDKRARTPPRFVFVPLYPAKVLLCFPQLLLKLLAS